LLNRVQPRSLVAAARAHQQHGSIVRWLERQMKRLCSTDTYPLMGVRGSEHATEQRGLPVVVPIACS
jgi:hypothetical protein